MSYLMDVLIINAVEQLQRNMQITDKRGVYPWHVSAHISAKVGLYRCEQSLRKDMSRLAQNGKLIRIGSDGINESRRGYKLAKSKPVQTTPRIIPLRQRFDLVA